MTEIKRHLHMDDPKPLLQAAWVAIPRDRVQLGRSGAPVAGQKFFRYWTVRRLRRAASRRGLSGDQGEGRNRQRASSAEIRTDHTRRANSK